jgi:hypothetical protein
MPDSLTMQKSVVNSKFLKSSLATKKWFLISSQRARKRLTARSMVHSGQRLFCAKQTSEQVEFYNRKRRRTNCGKEMRKTNARRHLKSKLKWKLKSSLKWMITLCWMRSVFTPDRLFFRARSTRSWKFCCSGTRWSVWKIRLSRLNRGLKIEDPLPKTLIWTSTS